MNICGLKYDFSRILSLLIRPLNFTQVTCPQLQTNTRTSISRKICSIKSGFQILYVVEQFSSLFSNDKLKQGAHIHQTLDLPSPCRMSWYGCCAVPSQQLPHVFVELALKGLAAAVKGFCTQVSPVTDRWPCHAVEPQYEQNRCPWLPCTSVMWLCACMR